MRWEIGEKRGERGEGRGVRKERKRRATNSG
jgi:hypothetical protein